MCSTEVTQIKRLQLNPPFFLLFPAPAPTPGQYSEHKPSLFFFLQSETFCILLILKTIYKGNNNILWLLASLAPGDRYASLWEQNTPCLYYFYRQLTVHSLKLCRYWLIQAKRKAHSTSESLYYHRTQKTTASDRLCGPAVLLSILDI